MKKASGGILYRDGKILLARRSPHLDLYPGYWGLVGGRVVPGETMEQALVREIREETGVTATGYFHIASLPDEAHGIMHYVFLVPHWDGGEPQMIGADHTSLRWLTPHDAVGLPNLAMDSYRPVFQTLHELTQRIETPAPAKLKDAPHLSAQRSARKEVRPEAPRRQEARPSPYS